jgi:TRAP-type C4-dicarboxylate transport system permease small subunit
LAGNFEKLTKNVSLFMKWVAGCTLVVMMLLTSADVVGRSFGRPIPGTYEIVEFLSAITISFALAYTQFSRSHVSIDLFIEKLPVKARKVVDIITHLFSFCLFALIAWQSFVYASKLRVLGVVSPTEQIPYYPIIYGIAFACVTMCSVIIVQIIGHLNQK